MAFRPIASAFSAVLATDIKIPEEVLDHIARLHFRTDAPPPEVMERLGRLTLSAAPVSPADKKREKSSAAAPVSPAEKTATPAEKTAAAPVKKNVFLAPLSAMPDVIEFMLMLGRPYLAERKGTMMVRYHFDKVVGRTETNTPCHAIVLVIDLWKCQLKTMYPDTPCDRWWCSGARHTMLERTSFPVPATPFRPVAALRLGPSEFFEEEKNGRRRIVESVIGQFCLFFVCLFVCIHAPISFACLLLFFALFCCTFQTVGVGRRSVSIGRRWRGRSG